MTGEGVPGAAALVARMLDVIEHEIVPLTRRGVARGDKVFGAAILRRTDRATVVAATNGETANPLWHGEIQALRAFYEIPADRRPPARECLFLSTHEPCPLCLSAITWAGFDNFHYLFGYGDTAERFDIPHDLRILEEVFGVAGGAYRRRNAYWTAYGLPEMIAALPEAERAPLAARVRALEEVYAALSDAYQARKGGADIPLP